MKLHKISKAFTLHFLAFAAFVFLAVAPAAAVFAQSEENSGATNEDVRKVLQLFNEKRFAEAVPYMEKIVKDEPNDPELRYLYGFPLFVKAASVNDKSEAKSLLAQARREFIKAKELGSKNETIDKLLAIIPAEGDYGNGNGGGNNVSTQNFSKNKKAEEAMNKGEGYFAQKEYDKAFDS